MAQVPKHVADRLYETPPDRFVAARTEAADEVRAAGDPALAREIQKMRRPTIAAWLVNLLAIRRPDLIGELTELAAEMRAAQRALRGDELRELSGQRRAVVRALVAQARDLAVEVDPDVAPARLPLEEAETTLNAAFSDEEVAERLVAGRLLRAAAYAGFGEVPRPQLRLVTGGAVEEPQRAGRRADGEGGAADRPGRRDGGRDAPEPEAEPAVDVAALRRALASARTGQRKAEAELERAAAAERDGARALADIEAQLAELERRRAAADHELGRRKLARKAAERAAVAARRRLGEAQAAVESVQSGAARR